METSKESLLMAQDSRTRDAILFDMMEHISSKIDKANEIEDRVGECESNITCVGRIGVALTTLFSIFAAWFKFGQ
jgi:hypothetical protein